MVCLFQGENAIRILNYACCVWVTILQILLFLPAYLCYFECFFFMRILLDRQITNSKCLAPSQCIHSYREREQVLCSFIYDQRHVISNNVAFVQV